MAIGSTFGSRGFLGGRWRTACLWRTATRRYLSTTHRSPLHVRQHAGGDRVVSEPLLSPECVL